MAGDGSAGEGSLLSELESPDMGGDREPVCLRWVLWEEAGECKDGEGGESVLISALDLKG